MSKKESVEFQIYKSDVMNEIRNKQKGEEVEKLASSIFELGEENFDKCLVMLAFKAALGADEQDLFRIAETLTITRNFNEKLYKLWVALFMEMFDKKFNKEV